MLRTKKYLAILACFAGLGFGATACGDTASNNDTPSYERPEGSRAFISDEQLAEIEDLGVPIHDGANPPDISGTFEWDSSVWTIAPRQQYEGREVCDGQRTYTLEDDGTVSSTMFYTNCDGEGSSSGIFISGTDNCFTLYSTGTGDFEGCTNTTVTVGSGCLTDEGIKDSLTAWYVSSYGDGPCQSLVDQGRMPPEGGIVVNAEEDGMMSRVSSDN